MTDLEAQQILQAYGDVAEVHDVTVVSTDGKHATADVVYSQGGGDLLTVRVEFTIGPIFNHLETPDDFPSRLIKEVISECLEACKYQRDLNREKN